MLIYVSQGGGESMFRQNAASFASFFHGEKKEYTDQQPTMKVILIIIFFVREIFSRHTDGKGRISMARSVTMLMAPMVNANLPKSTHRAEGEGAHRALIGTHWKIQTR